MKKKFFVFFSILLTVMLGCKKLVEVPSPVTTINQTNVYDSDATAIAVLNTSYARLSAGSLLSGNSIHAFSSSYLGVSSDELVYYLSTSQHLLLTYYTNNLTSAITNPTIWYYAYPELYIINTVIENLQGANGLSPAVRQKLLGEAYFLRAYNYFYLVNLYGDVPLITTSDYKVNSIMPRTAKETVYGQMIADLIQAKSLLSKQYLKTDGITVSTNRIVPNYYAATALLARVYLFHKEYDKAEVQSTEVINETTLYGLEGVSSVFLASSKETIFSLQPVNANWNTEDARFYKIPSTGLSNSNPVYLSPSILSKFESGDNRRTAWIGKFTDTKVTPNKDYYYPYKYKSATSGSAVTEYSVVLRLAEQFLIRSESRAWLGKISEAQADLNRIRNRAGLGNTVAADKDGLLSAILNERATELFSETGHRWLDLKRTENLDNVMKGITASKGGLWNANKQLFPIIQVDLNNNPFLTQNPGY